MPHILVAFTGGTIGSRNDSKRIDVDASTSFELIDRYKQAHPQATIRFESIQPLQLLSENLIPSDWMTLRDAIEACATASYDGIIIPHGSDTLAYTAAAMSYVFHDTKVPIVLIASKYPLDDTRGRGVENFANAVDFIVGERLPGVYVIFEDDQGRSIVHLGTRILQAAHFTDEYESAYGVPFGTMTEGRLVTISHRVNPTLAHIREGRSSYTWVRKPAFSDELLHIRPYPGMDYRYYALRETKPKAIFHDLYHSGTGGTRALPHRSLADFTDLCKQLQIDLYIGPVKHVDGDLYASSTTLLEAGAKPLENITVEAALVKLMLAYGTFDTSEDIQRFLKVNLSYENIPTIS